MATTFPDPNSIVDYLKSTGQSSDYASRAKLYESKGLGTAQSYTQAGKSNASQNLALLQALRGGINTTPPVGTVPTGTPTGTGATGSILPEGFQSRYQSQNAKDLDALGNKLSSNLEEPSLEGIRRSKMNAAKAITDAINAQFESVFAREREAGEGREKRTRALNIASGLGGSDFASSAAIKTEQGNQRNMDLIAAERDAKINSILAGVEDRASEEYQRQRAEYTAGLEGEYERKKAAVEEDRARATESIGLLAGEGITFDALKANEPDIYNQLMKESGMSELEFQAKYNASLPENQKADYEYRTVGNKVIRFNKNGGEPEEFDFGGGSNKTYDIKELKDGTLIKYDKESGAYSTLREGTPEEPTEEEEEKANKFLNKDYFRGVFDEKTLKKEARKAGYGRGGTDQYLASLEKVVEQYRTAGYTDKEILEMMQEQ